MKYGVFIVFFVISCSGRTSTETETIEISNIIDLTAGLENIQTVCLSEIADSVTFIPLETNRKSNLADMQDGFQFSSSYIFWFSKYFDWNGQYVGSIGTRGKGPFEEPEGIWYMFLVTIIFTRKEPNL